MSQKTKHQKSILPDTGFIRLTEVLEFIPVSKSTWWAGVKSGRFPKPVRISDRITCWRAKDIKEFIVSFN